MWYERYLWGSYGNFKWVGFMEILVEFFVFDGYIDGFDIWNGEK